MIHLTQSAAQHVANFIANRGKGEGIRLGVKTSGCSGLAYVLEFVDEVDPHDEIFENHGVKVFVDPKSLVYLDGLEMDYVKNGLNEGFEFSNPNQKGECGCGESFTV
ncbi:MAG: iron-sulfur cluster assembly protein IscA [Acinetobacter populi]|jgi:iron-sulfur cluster assembly protein|uniref:iron-sulfur cluster assembly protein IscA n=1 Tax=Acinetobacter populi TaxID=1582270 RepID=UPI002357ACE5|nr:iron-sulfur cluster assembly protein IscA [Acinetobacter populi]MCH4247444.1 iron-sulfur cluster assembly protein IscA [Acinetobacter populi]